MNRIASLLLPAALLVAIGCNPPAENAKTETAKTDAPKTEAPQSDMLVGVVFDSGGRGDKSFNDSAWAGIERASQEFGIKSRTVESKSEKDYETNLAAMAQAGADIVFAIGISQGNALKAVAPRFPDTKFAIIDGGVEGPNVRSLSFAEEQGSFLAGYAAGLATKTNKVGFVGGMEIPLIKKFEAGYIAGAKTANPNVEVLPSKYTASWVDTSLGKAAANVLFKDGADVVYHASGRCGLGVIEAAKDNGKLAIGVDSNQDDVAPGFVLTSMIKRVDEAVYQTIKDVKDGAYSAGTKVYDLGAKGVGLTDFQHTLAKLPADGKERLAAVEKKIVDGTLKVPTTMEELDAYLKTLAR